MISPGAPGRLAGAANCSAMRNSGPPGLEQTRIIDFQHEWKSKVNKELRLVHD